MAAKIEIRGLRKVFQTGKMSVTALENFDLRIDEGEFICLVGPSGCGKTTLLRILAGLDTPSEGEVLMSRKNPATPLTSMVFQETSVFPWMTVRDNVAYGLALRGVDPEHTRRAVNHFFEFTGC